MSDIQETMAKKRKAADTMQAILEGQTRTVRILTYTKAQLPTAHCLELGGFDGMLIFNDGQATFNVQQTTFIRVLLRACNWPNVYNYSSTGQTPFVPAWQTGAALPFHGPHNVESITARIKLVAEDTTASGLKMASLIFEIVPSDVPLVMRDATAKHICLQHGMNVPPAIADAYQCQSAENHGYQCQSVFQTTPPRSTNSTASSPGSSASHGGAPSSTMQAEFVEGIKILRGIKRAMQARKIWVDEEEAPNQCAQM